MKAACVLLAAFNPLFAGAQTDTLSAAGISARRDSPVISPVESVRLDSVASVSGSLADAVLKFTGVQLKDYGGAGGLKTVNVRSLGSEHVGIYLEGIRIDNAQNMHVDLGRFSTDALESAELYTGQKAQRLQTAAEYTAGAALHLNSGRPQRNSFRAKLRGGSLQTVNPSLSWDRIMKGVSLRTGAEFLYSGGKYPFPYFDTTLLRENADIRSLRLQAQLYGNTNGGDWQLTLYGYGSERGFPGPVIRRASGFPFSAERQEDLDAFVQGRWTHQWTAKYATAVRFKYSGNYVHYNTHPELNPMALPWNLHFRQHSGYLSLAQSFSITPDWEIDFSTDVTRAGLDSDAAQNVTPRRTTLSGALATRLGSGAFRAAAHLAWQGARDEFDTPVAGGWSRENAFRHAWMPSISIGWKAAEWLELDAYARRSWRMPTFNDLYYGLVGNSSLEPESALQAGGDVRASANGPSWSASLRLSPYYNRVSNKIVAIPTSSQFRWTMLNIGIADIVGVELSAGGSICPGEWKFEAMLRYTFQQALDHSTPGALTYGGQLPYIPLHSGSLCITAEWKGFRLETATTACGTRWSRSANTDDYRLAPWSTTDVLLGKRFRLQGDKVLTAGVQIKNIFNTRYEIVQGYPMPGANLLASISIDI